MPVAANIPWLFTAASPTIRMPISVIARIATTGSLLFAATACSTTSGIRSTTHQAANTSTVSEPIDVTMGLRRDPALGSLLSEISAARIRDTDSILVSFGTRHTMSDTLSATRGVGAARRFLYRRMNEISQSCGGCLRVEYDAAMVEVARHPQKPVVNVVNVLAWLPGRDTSRVIVIGGHYDSCVCTNDRWDITSDAPGADDDGSGTSAVVELARVFSQRHPKGLDATIIFALYSGEEQGLLGSTPLAKRLHDSGYTVATAITTDNVGNVVADDGRVDSTSVRVFGADPDTGPSRELARYAWATGTLYLPEFAVFPVFRLDRFGRGGDHSPFVTLKDPGLRITERLENYKRQHLPTDGLADVNFSYVAKVARLNAAIVGGIASAPAAPDSLTGRRDQASGGQKWMLAWRAVPGAVSYEILVRRTTSAIHEKVIRVSTTSYVIGDQVDDLTVSVRSVGANGHRSLATVLTPPAPARAAAVAPPGG